MKNRAKTGIVLKTGVAALALCMLGTNARAATSCAQPRDMMALQVAALQQQLMVAALTCHDAAAYNRFVISHRPELQSSDRALMHFFQRQDGRKGADGYNAYKTELANDASLQSVRNSQFCPNAKAAFNDVRGANGPLAEFVSQRPSLIRTGFMRCTPDGRDQILMADATPNLPAQHQTIPDSQPADLTPDLTSRLDRALPPVSPRRAVAPPHDRADSLRDGQRTRARENPEAEIQNGDAQDGGDRDVEDADPHRGERQYLPYVNDEPPHYDPEYAAAPPPSVRDNGRNGDRYGREYGNGTGRGFSGNTGDDRDGYGNRQAANDVRGGDRDGYGNRQAANDVRGGDRDGYSNRQAANDVRGGDREGYDDRQAANDVRGDDRYADDGPDTDRSYADGPHAFPPHTRLVRGPDGRWYALQRRD